MLKPIGLIEGHYECRSLGETLPVFTDLLAMEVVERKANQAALKHPNTDWRLVVHESSAGAPEKTFDNHYGFRVASHTEVDAAWEYIQAHKEKYRIDKITKPQKAHFGYSVYFHEPGGNHLEIEYYNPGSALHGRAHTAGHWEKSLSEERFPGRGYIPQALTHGTLQCDNLEKTKAFTLGVLGPGAGRRHERQNSLRQAPIDALVYRHAAAQSAPIPGAGESIHLTTRHGGGSRTGARGVCLAATFPGTKRHSEHRARRR